MRPMLMVPIDTKNTKTNKGPRSKRTGQERARKKADAVHRVAPLGDEAIKQKSTCAVVAAAAAAAYAHVLRPHPVALAA